MPRSPGEFRREEPVDEAFFRRQAREVARDLVGTLLVNEAGERPVGGLVVEAEAYVNAVDPACHLAHGRTPRTEPFFAGAGTVYVFSMHGHANLNFITEYEGHPEGVLVRALAPTHGVDRMRERRGFDDATRLASGPGKLTEALGVGRELDGESLDETPLSLHWTDADVEVRETARIGVTSAADWPLRFVAAGNPHVSKPAPGEDLDFDAVDAAYERLRQADGDADLPTVDGR